MDQNNTIGDNLPHDVLFDDHHGAPDGRAGSCADTCDDWVAVGSKAEALTSSSSQTNNRSPQPPTDGDQSIAIEPSLDGNDLIPVKGIDASFEEEKDADGLEGSVSSASMYPFESFLAVGRSIHDSSTSNEPEADGNSADNKCCASTNGESGASHYSLTYTFAILPVLIAMLATSFAYIYNCQQKIASLDMELSSLTTKYSELDSRYQELLNDPRDSHSHFASADDRCNNDLLDSCWMKIGLGQCSKDALAETSTAIYSFTNEVILEPLSYLFSTKEGGGNHTTSTSGDNAEAPLSLSVYETAIFDTYSGFLNGVNSFFDGVLK